MRNAHHPCLLILALSLAASCHTIGVTRIPDDPPATADKPLTGKEQQDPGPQQAQYAVIGSWRLVSSSGGFTGKDSTVYRNSYYTFTADSFVANREGKIERGKYEWREVKDIHTGKTTNLMSGIDWVFTPKGKDTLYADMNAYDGYRYLLVRTK